MHLKYKHLKKLDTQTLFGISLILGQPRLQTKVNFVEELSGVKIDKSQQVQIKNLINSGQHNFKSGDMVLASAYYGAHNTLISSPNYSLKCKILSISKKRVYARVQTIIHHSPLSPVILSTIEIPISKCKKI